MSERTEILTPVGRLVQGDPFDPQTKDAEGNPLTIKSGPNAGQPRVDYFMALAIPKTDPGLTAIQTTIANVARQSFPTLFDASGVCVAPKFAFKMVDGDSTTPNGKGIKPCDRVGFPGNVVFYLSSGFAPKCYTKGGAEVIADPSMIKRGYYIRIHGSVAGNGSQTQPGVFLNHDMVELVGYGDEINTGPDGNAVFGGTPAGTLPPGASATPLAGAPIAAGVVPAAMPMVPGAQTPAPAPAGPAAPPVTPAPDFLNPPAAPAAVKYTLPDGTVWEAAQLKAVGYTTEQLAALPQS